MTKCKECGAAGQGDRFCEECGKEVGQKTSSGHGKQVFAAAVAIAVAVALFFVLSQTGSTAGATVVKDSNTGLVNSPSQQQTQKVPVTTSLKTPVVAAGRPAETKTLTASISRMTCGGCVSVIERAVSSLPGVKSVDVSLAQKQGQFVYDPSVTDKQKILDAINNLGYQAAEASDTPSGQASATGYAATGASTTSSPSKGGCGCGG